MRLDQSQQSLPGDYRMHLGQKALPARDLALVLPGPEAKLICFMVPSLAATVPCTEYRSSQVTCAEFP